MRGFQPIQPFLIEQEFSEPSPNEPNRDRCRRKRFLGPPPSTSGFLAHPTERISRMESNRVIPPLQYKCDRLSAKRLRVAARCGHLGVEKPQLQLFPILQFPCPS